MAARTRVLTKRKALLALGKAIANQKTTTGSLEQLKGDSAAEGRYSQESFDASRTTAQSKGTTTCCRLSPCDIEDGLFI